MNTAVILNGDQVYVEELIRENARLTIQVEAERQRRRELEAALARLKLERESLSSQTGQMEENVDLAEGKQSSRRAQFRSQCQPELEVTDIRGRGPKAL